MALGRSQYGASPQAVDYAKFEATATIQQLWLIQVRSSGSSGDLRYVLPYMIRAAQPHFGLSTNRELSIPVSVDDPAAEEIRTGAQTGIPGAPTSHWGLTALLGPPLKTA